MAPKILCVAEKPSIAKAVAQHLSGGNFNTRPITGSPYVKNYEFEYTFAPPWGSCSVVMTSVLGHLTSQDFDERYRRWNDCDPGQLFDAPIVKYVDKKNQPIAKNIESQAAYAKGLFIWTDCDREGEHIGTEIREAASKRNARLEVKRARFSNIERAHVLRAAQNPIAVDEHQANAIEARIELDLRIGAAFTRLQTLNLQRLGPELSEAILSYGSCQFPTLGFVVDRYFRVRNFIAEDFWSINVTHTRDDILVRFSWDRVRVYDRMSVTIMLERCLRSQSAEVMSVQKKPTSKWRPLPLTTLDLQKMGTWYLRMDSATVMKVAEELYNKGFISYPRTETDQFDKGMDLKKLVEKQIIDDRWGGFARELLDGNFRTPRAGRKNDKAHPPIHPICHASPSALGSDQHCRVYELVTRRFLACCSEDAKGESTDVKISYGDERFHTHGLTVIERNYLNVYPYDKWESTQQLPRFAVGERFVPDEANIVLGKTSPPAYLTEADLLALMDANGIGTDATMADHIAKIQDRNYVMTRPRSGTRTETDDNDQSENGVGRRGGRTGRGSRGSSRGARGGASSSGSSRGSGQKEFIPTTLGVALVKGYENVGFETSLSKPFLRKEVALPPIRESQWR
ncbi:MAG: hypothetical protein M1825_006386 [Sarcosagium campestre]|nr:MAG: hypothetical protein M1825_006386 [Sarcosagium campestre]